MTKKLYTIQAKVITFRWYWENFLANINKDKPTDKKLFIHIPKNAGMTIRRSDLLKDKIIVARPVIYKTPKYSQELLTTMNKTRDHHGYEHARWRDIHPRITNQHKSFAVIRNPWDRVASRFFFAKLAIEVQKKSPPAYADISSFEAFLEERHKWGDQEYMWHRAIRGWYPAFDHVSDESGKVQCDCLRFEKLDYDLCKYFNIPKMTKPRNVTGLNKGSYMDIYNKKTIQIVADWYEKDITTWGFDFDKNKKKNTTFS